ncbi:MAG: hypothetical protein ACK5VE_03735 [Alphaproteobacteria bacterium]
MSVIIAPPRCIRALARLVSGCFATRYGPPGRGAERFDFALRHMHGHEIQEDRDRHGCAAVVVIADHGIVPRAFQLEVPDLFPVRLLGLACGPPVARLDTLSEPTIQPVGIDLGADTVTNALTPMRVCHPPDRATHDAKCTKGYRAIELLVMLKTSQVDATYG